MYLVPRADGELVVGASEEERGADTTVTAGGVLDLLRPAADLLPGVAELALAETLAGLRPGTPDNAPVILGHSSTAMCTSRAGTTARRAPRAGHRARRRRPGHQGIDDVDISPVSGGVALPDDRGGVTLSVVPHGSPV